MCKDKAAAVQYGPLAREIADPLGRDESELLQERPQRVCRFGVALAMNAAHIVAEGAVVHNPPTQVGFATLYFSVDFSFPYGACYGVNCLWSEDADGPLTVLPACLRHCRVPAIA